MENVRPNVLVLKTILKSLFETKGVDFADWQNDWAEIDSFLCRTSSCDGCVNCQLECQASDSNLTIVSTSWGECEFPYGFEVDYSLSPEQKGLIAAIVILSVLFVMGCYYLINGIYLYYSSDNT